MNPEISPRLRGAPVDEGVLSSRTSNVCIGIEFMGLTLDPDNRVLRYTVSVKGTYLPDGNHVPNLMEGSTTYEGIDMAIGSGFLPLNDGYCLIDGRMKDILRIIDDATSR